MKIDIFMRHYYSDKMKKRLLRSCNGMGYYFNSEGIYCSEKLEVLYNKGIIDSMYVCRSYDLYKPEIDGISGRIISRAITSLKAGDNISKFFEYVETFEPRNRELPTGLDRFITRIVGPNIQREYGNKNTATFDFIYVDVCIIHSWETNKKEYIKQNMPEIKKRVLEKIENSKRFQKFGIPTNFLKLTSITLTRDDVLHFIFELKIK